MAPGRRISVLNLGSLLLIAGIVLSLLLPYRHGEAIHRNETKAAAALERIHRLEVACRKAGPDGAARFVFLQELGERTDGMLASRFRTGLGGRFEGVDLCRSGYRFRVFLPDAEGHGVTFARRAAVSREQARRHFACYAWPTRFGATGRRVFLLLGDGTVLEAENQKRRYGGAALAPSPGAGFRAADPDRIVDSPAATGTRARGRGIDGQFWSAVNLGR